MELVKQPPTVGLACGALVGSLGSVLELWVALVGPRGFPVTMSLGLAGSALGAELLCPAVATAGAGLRLGSLGPWSSYVRGALEGRASVSRKPGAGRVPVDLLPCLRRLGVCSPPGLPGLHAVLERVSGVGAPDSRLCARGSARPLGGPLRGGWLL